MQNAQISVFKEKKVFNHPNPALITFKYLCISKYLNMWDNLCRPKTWPEMATPPSPLPEMKWTWPL